ncbi:EST6 protein, partial [Acromyrmex charruanus]
MCISTKIFVDITNNKFLKNSVDSGLTKEKLETMKLLIAVLCFGFAIHANASVSAPKVKTPLGGLKGYYKVSQNGRKYEAYEGIPYALPPIGKLRFKPPRPIPAWIGELSATKFGSACIQYDHKPEYSPEKVVGAEDCLYLNVYVPVREKEGSKLPLPVLFWIHGGAFQFGSGMLYSAKYLMDSDVILVTINYRLGPMGFLSTEDEVVPGNMGLKDQSMALRWVSQNIEWFGGDPNKVTLVGLSAGGASVHYHYLSQMSAGLFQGGISFSGTAFDCWTQAENSKEKAKKLSALMGCPTTSSRDMIRCLRHRPSRAIVQATSEFMSFFYNPFSPYGPVVEKFGDEAPFIDRTPVEIINSGDVQDIPWVTGVTSEEGLYPVAEFISDDESLKQLNDNWDILGPNFLDFNYTIPKEKHVEIARLIKEHYFGTKSIDRQSVKELIQMASDRFFVVDGEKAARMQAKVNQNPVWFHYFNYRGEQSLSDSFSDTTVNYGVSHGDDTFYVVDTNWLNPTTTQKDRDMQKHLIDFWVLFATEGIPKVGNVEWLKLDPSKQELHYLNIAGPDKINMDSNANLGEKEFWNSIDFNENVLKHTAGINKDEL